MTTISFETHDDLVFNLGDLVQLVMEQGEPHCGMVHSITVTMSRTVLYNITWEDRQTTTHFHHELKLFPAETWR